MPFRPPGGDGEHVGLLPREAIRAPVEPGPAEPACGSCPALPQGHLRAAGGVEQTFQEGLQDCTWKATGEQGQRGGQRPPSRGCGVFEVCL